MLLCTIEYQNECLFKPLLLLTPYTNKKKLWMYIVVNLSCVWIWLLLGEHSEIWRLTTSMEDYKAEIEDWDLGAGIYLSFYFLRSSLQEENDAMNELVCI